MKHQIQLRWLASSFCLFCSIQIALAQVNNFWSKLTIPYGGAYVTALTYGANSSILMTCYKIYRSTDNGTNWTELTSGLPQYKQRYGLATLADGSIILTVDGGVYKSTNNGGSWSKISTQDGFQWLALAPNGTLWSSIRQTVGGIYKSTDGGVTWLKRDSANGIKNFQDLDAITFDASGAIFIGGSDANSSLGGIYKSTDGGDTWTEVSNGLTNKVVMGLAYSSATNSVFAATKGYVFRSSDNGANWTVLKTGLSASYVKCVAVAPNGHIHVGTSGGSGSYRSTDNGDSWETINGISSIYTTNFIWVAPDNYLYAGQGYDLFRSSSAVTSVEHAEELPRTTTLYQNYPDPFNPSTTIEFRVPSSEFISLKVYDVLGREVATLVNEVKKPGTYSVKFDGSPFVSGVYFYRMTATGNNGERFVSIKKLVLIK